MKTPLRPSAPSSPALPEASASSARVGLAFATIYLVWGSTYLAIRFAVETIPPFLMAGVRFTTAGALLYAVLRARGVSAPTAAQWRMAVISGALMILGGNGVLSWAEQYVPSGLAALLVATVPLWFVGIAWLGPDREPSRPLEIFGLLLGLAGVILLVAGSGEEVMLAGTSGRAGLWASLAIVGASISWAAGSLYHRRAALPRPGLFATAMTMLAGGALLLGTGVLRGEVGALQPEAISARSLLALLYLIAFGSIVAFSAYAWLLRAVRPALVGTYAYVNPVVAVLLGWWLADEILTGTMLIGAAVIVASVILVERGRLRTPRRRPVREADPIAGGPEARESASA